MRSERAVSLLRHDKVVDDALVRVVELRKLEGGGIMRHHPAVAEEQALSAGGGDGAAVRAWAVLVEGVQARRAAVAGDEVDGCGGIRKVLLHGRRVVPGGRKL